MITSMTTCQESFDTENESTITTTPPKKTSTSSSPSHTPPQRKRAETLDCFPAGFGAWLEQYVDFKLEEMSLNDSLNSLGSLSHGKRDMVTQGEGRAAQRKTHRRTLSRRESLLNGLEEERDDVDLPKSTLHRSKTHP